MHSLLLLLAATVAAPQHATLTGTVEMNGMLLPGATVTIESPCLVIPIAAVTDADGVFEFEDLPARCSYRAKAAAEGLRMRRGQRLTFSLREGQSATTKIVMQNAPPKLETDCRQPAIHERPLTFHICNDSTPTLLRGPRMLDHAPGVQTNRRQ